MKNEIETTTVEMGTDSKGRRIGKKIILEKIQRVSFDIDVDGCIQYRVRVETQRDGKKYGAYNYGCTFATLAQAERHALATMRKYRAAATK
ncbi:MAG: hypothetical protein IPJ01_12290 [Micavibrio sp.]|nr:hypothetical protein [Micavibrio sp.]